MDTANVSHVGSGGKLRSIAIHAALVAGFGVCAIHLAYVGFVTSSDDQGYVAAALGWLHHFPYIGIYHWELRHTVVIPIAISFWLGGVSETTFTLPTEIYFVSLLLLTYSCITRLLDSRTALTAAALVAFTPLFALDASDASDDLAELFFVAVSFWAFYFGSSGRPRPGLFLLSGLSAGLAFVTRETSAVLGIYYGLLFLVDARVPRAYYLLIGAGFFAILSADIVYLTTITGDPLYRFHLSLRGQAHYNAFVQADIARHPGRYLFDRAGLIAAPRAIRPILMLFASHEFGLIFFLAVPAVLWLLSTALPTSQLDAGRRLGLLGGLWFLTVSYLLLPLPVIPRYYSVTAYCYVVLATLWLHSLKLRNIALSLIVLLVASDLFLIYIDNKDIMFGERALVAFAQESHEVTYTTPWTRDAALFLLQQKKLEDSVVAGPPPSGALFFYDFEPRRSPSSKELARYAPRNDWIIVRSFDERPKITAELLRASGIEPMLPAGIVAKLDPPLHRANLYRVP
jgi:4-amino-4-deoxy-L-arabinose transferase-like glycosyltransferase